ncbi:MAG: SDR family NAD(P)-dependent oxidoreductase [Proteobacteria bacterium]|nr:SDR family NAD(P)-dependent oxidoreductase [Pseudomonadota bacterium]
MAVIIVTGTDSGIGRAVALDLSARHHDVVAVCLDLEAGEQLAAQAQGRVHPIACDFASLTQVRALAQQLIAEFPSIAALIHVAGIVVDTYAETEDGFERQLGINHLAPYLLTRLLAEHLESSSRVIFVASRAHRYVQLNKADPNREADYSGLLAYRQSKLGNVLCALALARRLESKRVTVLALHPGVTKTQIGSANTRMPLSLGWSVLRLFARPVEAAAADIVDLVIGERWEGQTGLYLRKSRVMDPAPHAMDVAEQEWMWEWSAKAVGLPSR